MSITIAPSILSSDFTRLYEECRAVLDAGADWLHVDVMDGHFVPNITIGLPIVRALRNAFPTTFIDVHLMIENPGEYAPRFAGAGANMVSFHPEATAHSHRIVQSLHDEGTQASLAINPATPLAPAEYLADHLDMLLIMSVNPGFSGQDFIPKALQKLKKADSLRQRHGRSDMLLEVDGGVSPENIDEISAAGADVFVSGSSIFGADSYSDRIEGLRQRAQL